MSKQAGLGDMGAVGIFRFGALIAILFLGGLFAWSSFAPLDAGATASGLVVVDSSRKQVQHLDGGIVAEINVEEGDRVEVGEVLLTLDATQSRVERDIIQERLISALAQEARLLSERDNRADITLSTEGLPLEGQEARINTVLEGQRQILQARKDYLASQAALTRQSQIQLEEEILGLQAEIAAQEEQLGYIKEEVASVQTLVDKGLERKPRLLALQREMAQIRGQAASNQAAVSRARQQIGEATLRLIDTETRLRNSVVEELRTVQTEVSSLREELYRAQSILDRTQVRSPVSGFVVSLIVNTVSGVVQPGATLMEIVPADDRLIVEAQVSPLDIDTVHVGLNAKVRLGSFAMDEVPELDAVVVVVSADRLVDEATGVPYFAARLRVDDSTLPQGVTLTAGMPADTMIITGQHTVLQYLVEPFQRRIQRAFSGG